MKTRNRICQFVLAWVCVSIVASAAPLAPVVLMSTPTAAADEGGGDGDGGEGGSWGPSISFGGRGACFGGRLGLCLGGLRPIPGAALRPVPPAGPAPRVGPRGTWP